MSDERRMLIELLDEALARGDWVEADEIEEELKK